VLHRTARTALGGALLAAMMLGCGDTTSRPAWVANHPDTAALSFKASAPGVCAITVQYPNDAPAAIDYLGSTYVQVSRLAHPAAAGGHDLGKSGDWDALLQSDGDILLVTPGDAFDYRLEASC
jgi:hypothetical protein